MVLTRIAFVLVVGSAVVAAQTSDPSFDVAAIKANRDGGKKA
jgi:hypothetical protein